MRFIKINLSISRSDKNARVHNKDKHKHTGRVMCPTCMFSLQAQHSIGGLGLPGRQDIHGCCVGQTCLQAAVSLHVVDLIVAIPVGSEGDQRAVRRPGG